MVTKKNKKLTHDIRHGQQHHVMIHHKHRLGLSRRGMTGLRSLRSFSCRHTSVLAFFFLLFLDSMTVKGFLLFFCSTFTAFDQNPFHSLDVFCLCLPVSWFFENSSWSSRWICKISLKEATSIARLPPLLTLSFPPLLLERGIFR